MLVQTVVSDISLATLKPGVLNLALPNIKIAREMVLFELHGKSNETEQRQPLLKTSGAVKNVCASPTDIST